MRRCVHLCYAWITLSTFLIQYCVTLNITFCQFTKENACNLQEKINQGCAEPKQVSARSLLACNILCKSGCTGVAWTNNQTCYTFKPCPAVTICNNVNFTFYKKVSPCQHSSVWNATSDTCSCVDGWVGRRCERLPRTCRELLEYGYPKGLKESRFFQLNISTYFEPISIRCVLYNDFEDWFIMANQGLLDNTNSKSWSDYEQGYKDTDLNFWLGLEKIKALNDFGLTRLVLYTGFKNANGNYDQQQSVYHDVELGDAFSAYNFTFSTVTFSSGFDGDCFSSLKGASFSAQDKDMDEDDTQNCAEQAGVGWWFKDCNMACNPLGQSYEHFPGPEKMSHMKIDDIDLANTTAFKSVYIFMYFQTKR